MRQNPVFSLDAVGNLTQRSDSAAGFNLTTETFAYDTLNRLTTVTGPAAKSFTYDAFGNLATRTDVGTLSYFPGVNWGQTPFKMVE